MDVKLQELFYKYFIVIYFVGVRIILCLYISFVKLATWYQHNC